MVRNMIGFGTGILFGLGLAVSHMVDPGKVLGFLDFFGEWDPSLLIVMGVAVAVTFVAYRMAKGRSAPVFAELFQWP
ncbi:MAG: YeeE/YedE family protein, partial [Alphaproteobacteria bacterium]|nr:YeeE/YedE family protein [Alphaproteobacteria bacterium]